MKKNYAYSRLVKAGMMLCVWLATTTQVNARTGNNTVAGKPIAAKPISNVADNFRLKKPAAGEMSGGKNEFFIENKGQVTDQNGKQRNDIQFQLAAAPGLNIFIGNGAIHYQFSRCENQAEIDNWQAKHEGVTAAGDMMPDMKMDMYRMDVELVGANKNAKVITEQKQAYYENYFTAAVGEKGATAYSYKRVIYKDIYPEIDWVLYTSGAQMKHEFVVHEGGKVGDIKLKYGGATALQIDEAGKLLATTPQGTIAEDAPYTYQQDGKKISSGFKLEGDILSYTTGAYAGELVIDPAINWGTYYGGGGDDIGNETATDGSGNVYIVGYTNSGSGTVIATAGSHQATIGGNYDVFLAKFNSSGVRQWGTYYGGSDLDLGFGVATDGTGNVYITGMTFTVGGTDIATAGSHQATHGGGALDAFLAKFNSSGVRQWGTYYGGSGNDRGDGVATDGTGNVYIIGYTGTSGGTEIATAGSHQATIGGSDDAFLAKFNSSGVRQWGTYYGGSGSDYGSEVATDGTGNVYISGNTTTSGGTAIATAGSHQATFGGGINKAFLAKFNSSGVRQWGTYYGGSGDDYGQSVATDGSGNVYITGQTNTSGGTAIATAGSHQATDGGSNDAFLAKFNSSGVRQWGTYYGGSGSDYGSEVATDGTGNVYITGNTTTSGGTVIATAGSHQATFGGSSDTYLVQFNSSGVRQWGTYYGGSGGDEGLGVATDGTGNVYISGYTTTSSGTAIATAGSHQPTFGGSNDAFLASFTFVTNAAPTFTGGSPQSLNVCKNSTGNAINSLLAVSDADAGQTLTWSVVTPPTNGSLSGVASYTATSTGGTVTPTGMTYTPTSGYSGTDAFTIQVSDGFATASTTVNVTVNALPTVSGGSNVGICTGNNTTLTASGASTYTWAPNTNLSATTGTSVTASPTVTVIYTVTGTDGNGCVNTASVQVSVNPLPAAITGGGSVTPGIITLVGGNGTGHSGDGGPATAAGISGPLGGTRDAAGNVYVAEFNASSVRMINSSGIISTIAGTGTAGYNGDGIAATSAQLNQPWDVAVDGSGNIYIADNLNFRVRKINTSGIISTFAGNGSSGFSGDGGQATAAQISGAHGLYIDGAGNVYIAERSGNRVRMVNTSGIISTFAGSGSGTSSGDGGPATAAGISTSVRIAGDGAGNIYVAQQSGHRIRKINSSGIISTIAGTGSSGFSGDGGPATAATITSPIGVAVDGSGNVFISDFGNHRIRMVNAAGVISTIAGTGTNGYAGDGGPATAAVLNSPGGVYLGGGFLYEVCSANGVAPGRVRKIALTYSVGSSVCTGSSITLTNATSGGTWSSNNGNVSLAGTATTTVTVTGVTAGTSVVSYTLPTGCYTTTTVTINQTPTAITGTLLVNVTQTTTLNSTPSGGTWSSSNANATVNSTSGVVTGVTAGTSVITYTMPGGCYATATVTVNNYNNGLDFDGSNDYAVIASRPSLGLSSGSMTIEFWAKPTIVDGNFHWVVAKDNTNSNLDYLMGITSSNKWRFIIRNLAVDVTGATTVVAGTWYHVAGVYNGTTATLYVNGVSDGTAATAGSAVINGEQVLIGARNFGGPTQFFGGTVDEVRIWNVARTLGQITGNMNCDVAQNANLVAYYRFDQGTASGTNTGLTCAYDYSGNSNSGTLTNMALTGSASNYVLGHVPGCNTITLPSPGTFSGNAPVCVGSTITLSNANPNGVWTSLATGTATVGSLTGVVTGVTSGTVTVNYTLNCVTSSVVVTVNPRPVVSFTAQPGANACAATNVTYTTQAGMTSYVWGFPGTAGVDYNIISGGTGTSNTVVLQYYTPGPHTVTVNYTDANGCTAASATSSTPTTIQMAPTITSVTPLVGAPTLAVSIVGTNFNTTTTNNIVYFGATRATVTSATATSLSVTVPVGATFSTLSVENDGCSLTGYSGKPFLQTYNNAPYIAGTVNLDPKVNFSGLTAAWGIALGDIDGDGKSDIVIGENGTSLIKVYRNTATVGVLNTSSFAAPVSFTANAATRGVTVRDVDNDGKLDVIVEGTSSVSVFRNNSTVGTIALDAKVDFASGSLPNYTAVEDLDGDGKADLAVANFSSGTVSVFRNTSTPGVINSGSFATNVDFAVNANPQGVAIGDMDGDGKKDIVVSNRGSNNISVIRNTSIPGTINGSSFAAKIDFTTASGPVGVVVADFDGDGKVDVATACYIGNVISVFRNTSTPGSITLPTRLDVPAGSVPFHQISVADMDGDSKPDLITGASGASSTIILRNISVSGTISFASLVSFPGDSNPYSVATGDLDGDNLPDVAVANQSDVVMTVYRNNPLQPITGTPTSICAGGTAITTTTYANATPNGRWSSSNPAVATVGSTTGVITGVSAGVATITYAGTATSGPALGNYTVRNVTVNPIPVPTFTTAPGATACVGNVLTYVTQSSQFTYLWTVTGTAGVDYSVTSGGTGTVYNNVGLKWLTVGTKTVTVNYTNVYGCINGSPATHTVTINPNPTAITGIANICVGQTTTLSSTPSGGTWTSSNTSVATIGSTSGFVNGVSAGTAFMTYTLATGCYAVRAVVVNPLPPISPTNTSPLCVGGLVNFAAGGFSIGATTYAWSGPAGFSSALTSPGISGVSLANAGVYTLTATATATGCVNTATTTVTINPVPTTTPTNTSPVCVGGTVNFNAVATAVGTLSYSWSGPSGFSSTSATPSRSSVTTAHAGSYVIAVSTPGSGCNATAVTVVTVNAIPAAAPTNSSPVCLGTMVTLSANPVSGTGVTGYSWSGPGGFTSTLANPTVTPTTTTTYSLTVTSGGASGCSPSTVYTTIVTVNPMPAAITPVAAICVGSTTSVTTTPAGGTWTSGSTSVATVAPSTGLVTAIGGGTATMTYTLPAGCYTTTVVTVNPLPAAIGGTAVMCAGASTTLTNTVSGGTWSSSNTGIATVGSTTGIVNGVAAGNATIIYTLPTGCFAVKTVTVNTTPGTITGTMSACVGATTTLSSSPTGGTWTSSNTGIATVSVSGVVSGVAAGTVTITYMLSAGCYTTASVTINPNPAAITGVMSICAGSTTTLASTTTGGTWSSSMPSVATVGASSGIVTGAIPGTAVITYLLPTGCSTTATVTVNTMPTTIASVAPICAGGTTTLSSTPGGGTWSSSNTAMATVSGSGVVSGLSAGNPVITYAIGSCYVTRMVTINPNPAAITGTMVLCSGSSTSLISATTGGTWMSTATGVATIGSTSGLLTGVSGGTATITYMMGTGCYTTATVTINTTPSTITGTITYCAGTIGTLTATPSGGTWSSSNTAMATVSGSGAVNAISAGTPVITYSFGTGCMSIVTLTINPNPAAITGTTTVCVGSITTLGTTSTGGTWSSSMPSVATVGASTGIVTGSIAGTTTITYTLPTGCYTTTNVTVNALPVIATWPGTICVSSTATLTATPAGGTWTSSNTGIATLGAGSGVATGVSAGTAMLTYTSGAGCSSATAVTVNGLPTIATWSGALCVSSTTTLNATPSGGTWSSSMSSVATIGATTGVLSGSIAGTTTVTYTLPTGCIATSVATVNPLPTAITGIMPICVGGNTTLASTPSGGMWSSSNTGVATVGSTSGIAAGVSAGTAVMTYTVSTGCIMTAVLTVNPLPAAITGITNVCTGFTTALFNASTGGTWSSSNTTLATIGSATGVVTGHVAGTLTITYTLPTGCLTTTSFTVNPTPAPVSGTLDVCVGLTTTLSTTPTGGTWTSSNPAEATIGGSTGLVTGMSAGMPIMTYTLPTGCRVMAVVTVNPLPAAITGASAVCTGAVTTLSSATTGGTWSSSSTGTATVGATTGIVTGVAAGTVTITYMLPTGCIATNAMTVNATPTAITGTLTVCTGYTTPLASSPTGGTWSSSNAAVGSVSSTGVVTGITAGMPVITYTLPTGCYITAAITINPTPPASTGSNQVCIGSTSTLANTLAGGTWSSSNPTIASVTASTGIVSGLVAGTLNITYTMPTGCFIVTPMTVNALPSSISGPGTVCPGATITLSSTPTGGTWTSSNTMIATVGSTSGIVTGVAGGNVTISYTLATGCRMTAVITVNPAPNLSSFSLPTATSPCVGNSSLVTLNSASIGSGTYTVTYDLAGANASTGNTATVVISSSTGSFTIPSSLLTLTGAQTAIITSITNSFGCSTTLTSGNVASFAVNVLPTVFTVSGGGGYCAGGTGLHIYLSGSTVGVNYQLYNGASPVGGFVAGTSTGLDFGVFTTAGTYTVVATNATTGCVSNMTGSATITINPLPTAFLVTGGGSYCAGGTGVLVGLAGSQTGVNYQLYNGSSTVGSPISGTGGTISFGLQTGGGTYTVVATDATTMCVSTMSGSVTVVVNPLPTAFTGPTAICQGSTTTLGSTPSGGTWTSGATSIATVASTSGFVTGVSGGVVTITYTLPTGCMMTGVLTVNPLPAAITGASSVCTGSSTPLASTTSGGIWTSSNTAFATAGSTSGSVTGVSAGTINITYTLGTGCYVIKPMTINATPAAISGSSTVCTGTTTILTSATTGGTWSSSASQASVIPTTGVVSGVSAGTATITYTLPSGCFVTFPMTVNTTPATIGGTMNVCEGATRTLTNTTSGGTWSSSNVTLATVGSTSGVVSGLAAGTVIISYTMPTGCFTTTSFTVNPAPAAITGLNNVCLGATIALSNTTSGGTWSSSASGTASVTSTGIVSGAATGTATITYTIPGGCFSIYLVTVNPNPATITGTANVCVAASTTLSNATAGGTWTSGNPTIASVGGATGIVTGLAAGTPTISYTLPTGCFAIRVVTVNPNPAAIAGPTNVCTGQAITLTNATTGGTWSSSNTALGTVNPTSGVVTGIAVGTPIISYTLGTGCFATYAVVVNQTPSAITGPSFVCVGSTVTLSNAYGGGTWSSSNTTLATVGASTGLVSGLATGMPVITYSLPPGCITTMVISVNPTPAMITGTMTVCVGSTTILSNATGGGIWSSGNPGVATITGSTGMVSGISAGTANITYTLPGGCTAVATVTVNPLPAPIAGTDNVCEGLSTTLTNTSGGGTWASSNTLVAIVGSASGVVTGLSAGTITITYTLPTSCFITMPFTVNPLPASITGTAVVCVNATTTLSDATTGGLWSISSPAIATIGSASGVVTGITGGNTIVTYTLPTGCIATRIVTVNPLPTIYAVTGGGGFCTGGTGVVVGLSGSNTGINYQLYNGSTPTGTPVAGTGASLSFGLITVAGTYTVKATNAVTGCFVNMGGTATVYGIPLPIQYTVTGGGSYCAGGSGFAVGLASSQLGVSYQLYNGATLMGAPLLGTGAPISFGTQTLAGTYTVVATNTSGCVSGMLGSVNIIVNPLPTVFTVTGGGAYCSGGSGAVVGLSGSATGINYQLYRGTTLVTTVSGTGSSISFGAMTVAGTYNVVAVNASTGCTNNMSGSVSVTISSLPVSTYTVGGGGAFCFGSAGVNVTLSNSDAGVNYQLLLGGSPVGSAMSGTGSSLNFGPQTTAGTYTIQATSTSTGCVAAMTGSVSVTVNPLPIVQFITGGGSYCAGGTGPAIGISGSQSGISYRLIRDGATLVTTVAGTGSAFSFGAQSVAGTYTIVAVNATTTCSVNMSGSTVISINPLPTAFTVTGGGGYCIGGSGVAVMLSGSQTGVNYQLFLGSTAVGSPVAGTGAAISFGNQTTGGTYTVVATTVGTGCVSNMSGSVAVTVNPLPTAYAVTGGGVYCTGGSGVAVGVANSQTNVNYQLFLGTSPVGSAVAGTTGSAISFGLQTTTGTYTVVATNAITGCVNNMTGSVTISVTSLPSMYLVTGGGSYCIGGSGVAIGLSGSQTGVSYRLYNGTTPVGSAISGTGGILSFGLQTAAGTYTVVATATSSCSSNMLGSVVVNINSLPTLFTVTGGGSYCTGSTGVSVGLSSSLAGTSYQLFRGTTPVGTPVSGTGLALNFGLMTVTGTYTVFATDLTTGCTQTMTGSVNVATNPLPTTYTVSGGGSYCSGGAGVSVGLGGSQSGIRYQLYRGSTAVGSPVAGTGSTISFGLQTIAGSYSVIATDTGTFCTRNMTGSVTVSVSALPNIYTMTGGGGFCTGGTGVAIGLTGSQAGVTYRLYLGGSTPIGSAISGTGAAISFGTHTLGGTYTVVATSTASACTSNMSGTAVITVNPLPTIFAVTGGGGYCSGGSGAGIGLANSTVGVNYQLYMGTTAVGAPLAGTGSPLNFGLFTTTGTYTVSAVTAATGCSRNMSGSAVVSVSSLPTAFSVTGGGSYCSGGAGVVVALSGSNTGISYQLFRGTTAVGSPVAGTGTSINFGLQTVAGTYTVMAVNTTTSCGRNMTGSATVVVNAAPAAFTVTGGGSYCTGSTGLAIGLSGSASGVTYRLYRGTTLVATLSGTGSTLSFGTFTTAGTYTVIATGSTTCTTTMTGSAIITVNALPAAFTVTGGGSYCAGGSGLSIGLSGSASGVSYQLMRGTTTVGGAMAGTGSALSFGLQTIAGTYTVVAVNATTGCTSAMTGSAIISIIAAPTVYTVTGGGAYCSGPGHNIYLSGSQTGVSYRLYLGTSAIGSPVSGTGSAINFGTFTTVGTYTVIATTGSSSCTMTMSGSASITSGSLPNLYSVTGGGSFCAGGAGYAVGLSGSQTGVNYQLYRGTTAVGAPVAGTGGALSFGTMSIAGGYTVVATNPTTGCIRSMSGSATIVVNALPTTFSLTGGGAYCSGGTGVTIGLGGSTSGISYKLYRGTVLASTISGTGSAISFGLHTTAGTYTVVATNVSTGCTSNMTGSATVSVNATPTISGSIYTVAPAGSITLSGSPTGGVWSSSATSVANVGSSSGVVSGVSLGTTTISYTMSTGCRATRTVSVTPTGHRDAAPESATGIVATNNNHSSIYVVPNPNKGVFTVKGTLSKLDEVEVTIELTNMLGQVMYSGKVLVHNGELSEVVRLSNSVANGMYLLNVNSPADSRVIHIVVEQ